MKFWIIKGLRSLKVRYPCASKTQIIAENEKKINAKHGQQNLDFLFGWGREDIADLLLLLHGN